MPSLWTKWCERFRRFNFKSTAVEKVSKENYKKSKKLRIQPAPDPNPVESSMQHKSPNEHCTITQDLPPCSANPDNTVSHLASKWFSICALPRTIAERGLSPNDGQSFYCTLICVQSNRRYKSWLDAELRSTGDLLSKQKAFVYLQASCTLTENKHTAALWWQFRLPAKGVMVVVVVDTLRAICFAGWWLGVVWTLKSQQESRTLKRRV